MKKLLLIILIFMFGFTGMGCTSKNNRKSGKSSSSLDKNPLPSEVLNSVENTKNKRTYNAAEKENKVLNLEFSNQLTAKLKPEHPTTDTDITVILPEDFTGEINWYVNGEKIIGEMGRTLPSRYFKRGDVVKVVAISSDGKKYVGEIKIINANPQISSDEDDFELDDQLIYHIKTRDPDGDPVEVEIVEAPEGYKYNPSTKTLIIPFENLPGEQVITFVVRAKDPYGGYTQKKIAYRLNIDIEKFK